MVGSSYSQPLTATGGKPSYTFSLSGGALPSGLSINNGTLSGTLTATSTFNFTLKATDANGCIGTRAYSLDSHLLDHYAHADQLADGCGRGSLQSNPAHQWRLRALHFQSDCWRAAGRCDARTKTAKLSGTPTAFGTFTFTVQARDGYGCTGSQAYALVIGLPYLPGDRRFYSDFDGDGKADLAIWRPSTATFWIYNSANGSTTTKQWGAATDLPVPGDYDGDGQTDIAVWRPSTGVWIVLNSSNGATVTGQWGNSTDVPVPGDYDGDGKTDYAIWRPSTGTWMIFKSSNSGTLTTQWGTVGDVPVPGDYDGDGKTDPRAVASLDRDLLDLQQCE